MYRHKSIGSRGCRGTGLVWRVIINSALEGNVYRPMLVGGILPLLKNPEAGYNPASFDHNKRQSILQLIESSELLHFL